MAMRLTIRRKLFLAFLAVVAGPLAATAFMVRTFLEQKQENAERTWVEEARRQLIAFTNDGDRRGQEVASAVAALGTELDDELDLDDDLPEAVLLHPQMKEAEKALANALKLAQKAKELAAQLDLDDVRESVAALKKKHPSVRWVQVAIGKRIIYQERADLGAIDINFPTTSEGRVGRLVLTSDDRLFAVSGSKRGPTVLAELDVTALCAPIPAGGGWVFQIDEKGGLAHDANADVSGLVSYPLTAIAAAKPLAGQLTRVRVPTTDEVYLVYVPAAIQRKGGYLLVAAIPEPVLRSKLLILRAVLGAIMVMAVPLAAFIALWLSSRLLKAVTNVREGVDAVARGEQAHLAKVSSDELGGALVESVNRLAARVAEQKRREEIESWRRLVRVLSHEINNTLGPVRSVASTARDLVGRLPQGEEAEDVALALKLILERTEALGAFIAGYAELAKLPEPRRAPVAANEMVAAAVSLQREAASAREQRLVEEYDERVGDIWLDRAQLERVVINLVKNAVEAAPVRGTVRVETHWTTAGFELIVDDDGPGISAEARKQLFVPYFTTKPGGSGVGLALARQIVLMHGGTIEAEDRPGGGARLRVTLPREPVAVEVAA
jgi:signal transduction histidine kinase